jgi:membrane carboxypeptidase/penicillin-binding protein
MVKKIAITIGVLLGILVAYLAAASAWAYTVTPTVIALASKQPATDLRSLPDSTVQILLRVEDPGFRKHKGVDPFTPGQGMATITSSLARSLYLHRYDLGGVGGVGQAVFRTVDKYAAPVDLAPEAMALVVNRKVSKDKQLRLFVQNVYMGTQNGRPVYGIGDAARVYFGKRTRDLTRRYVIALVGMMVDPDELHPLNHPDALAERIARIDRLLHRQCKPRGAFDVYYADCAPGRGRAN